MNLDKLRDIRKRLQDGQERLQRAGEIPHAQITLQIHILDAIIDDPLPVSPETAAAVDRLANLPKSGETQGPTG